MDTEELIGKIRMLLAGAWRRRWIGLAMACLLALTGAVGIVMMKDRYEASARIYVDTQTVLKPLMAGLAFQPDIDQQEKKRLRFRQGATRNGDEMGIILPSAAGATFCDVGGHRGGGTQQLAR